MTISADIEELAAPAPEEPKRERRGLRRNIVDALKLGWEASPKDLLVVAILVTATGAIPPLVVLLGKKLVDGVAAAAEGGPASLSSILPTVVALGALAAAQRSVGRWQTNRLEIYSHRVELYAEDRFLEAVSSSDAGHFDNPKWHDRVERASRDLTNRPSQMMQRVVSLGGNAVQIIGMGAILFGLHPLLLAIALISAVIPVPFQRRRARELYKFYWSWTTPERERMFLRNALTNSMSAKDIRAFNLQRHLINRHRHIREDLFRREAGIWSSFERNQSLMAAIGGALLAIAYGFVALRATAGEYSPGDITALIGAMTQISAQLTTVALAIALIEEHATFLKDYFSFVQIETLVPIPATPADIQHPIDSIEFDGVSFSYPGINEEALSDISLRIRRGELIALVGDNGAGKTTMVKLLLRFYDPAHGRVSVGGVDLVQTDPKELRRAMGVLFQDSFGYAFTAREAVTLGRPEVETTDEAVWEALRKARAVEVIKRLPKELDNYVGRQFEDGQDLSGGEWQRLALARLMFRDAGVWILDEPTASLDPETEAQIFTELKANLKGRIGIVVSHRFSTVRVADRIAVVEKGRIIELGTHDELMDLGGRYAQLFNLQAAGYR